ncbi:hypothetical protein ABZT11_42150, partial [Streptomyces avermitilis]
MNAIFTTPPRPFDITALFPQLAPLARTATRLHRNGRGGGGHEGVRGAVSPPVRNPDGPGPRH